jgi:hypothetical protein
MGDDIDHKTWVFFFFEEFDNYDSMLFGEINWDNTDNIIVDRTKFPSILAN